MCGLVLSFGQGLCAAAKLLTANASWLGHLGGDAPGLALPGVLEWTREYGPGDARFLPSVAD